MDAPSPQGVPNSAPTRADDSAPYGIIGIALAAVLTAALAQGAWEWFSTYIGVTLLAVIFSFYQLPTWTPGLKSAYTRNVVAYSLIVGLCTTITVAPMMQRWKWLFPMPGTRTGCVGVGAYEGSRVALANPTGDEAAALAYAHIQRHNVVADCLAATTTRWLPVYGAGAAVLVCLGAWLIGRARAKREAAEHLHNPRRDP
ncbi:hypothetical protein SAMN06272775_0161 [Streptomyces sp. 2323.1]|uniref:hypothetical protein n=1 Tax=Streptomyces sp. 2323.1 TaxID=1938841 RepID=UPI000BB7A6A1|nr:hypothetical protein [Streptomyces sp. 2323.1]SOE09079.1 hypothetical protein SAMN06272775_0161 [Streptomyces sp. 2323.1]